MASKLVNVVKAFTLTMVREGQVMVQRFEAGLQRLEQDVTDHWYTKAHTADVPEEATKPKADPVVSGDSKSSKK